MSKSHQSKETIQRMHDAEIGHVKNSHPLNKKLIKKRKQHELLNQLLDTVIPTYKGPIQ